MKDDEINRLINRGDHYYNQNDPIRAYEIYDQVFPLALAFALESKKSKTIGNVAGWAAGFLTGGFGFEDLFIIPAVSQGVAQFLGSNDTFVKNALTLLCLRQINILLNSDKLIGKIPADQVAQKFALLYSSSQNPSGLYSIIDLYLPSLSTSTPFDNAEAVYASKSYLRGAINFPEPEIHDYNFLLYSYLEKIQDQSELFQILSAMFGKARENKQKSGSESTSSRGSSTHNGNRYYDVLGLKPGASKEEIRKAYVELMKKYHPDRFASLAKEFQDIANRKAQEINEAYENLIK